MALLLRLYGSNASIRIYSLRLHRIVLDSWIGMLRVLLLLRALVIHVLCLKLLIGTREFASWFTAVCTLKGVWIALVLAIVLSIVIVLVPLWWLLLMKLGMQTLRVVRDSYIDPATTTVIKAITLAALLGVLCLLDLTIIDKSNSLSKKQNTS